MHATVLAIHIGAGAVALVVGFVALYAAKGAGLHRRSGTVFVYAMVAMAMLGAAIAGVWGPAAATNVPVGLLSTYLVITALTTVVPERRGSRAGSIGLMLGASTVGLFMFSSALQALARGGKSSAFAVPLLVFTAVGLLGAAGDLHVLRRGARTGAARLRRHVWRMCTALLIAVLSFSTRLPRILPAPLRSPVVYSLPMLVVLATMIYWLWRVRGARGARQIRPRAARGHLATETV